MVVTKAEFLFMIRSVNLPPSAHTLQQISSAHLQCSKSPVHTHCSKSPVHTSPVHISSAANLQCTHTAAAITSSVHTAAILSSAHTVQLHYLVSALYNTFSAPFNNHRVSPHQYWPTSRAVSRH